MAMRDITLMDYTVLYGTKLSYLQARQRENNAAYQLLGHRAWSLFLQVIQFKGRCNFFLKSNWSAKWTVAAWKW